MDRRRFLLSPVAGVVALPLAAQAQQAAKIARIGWLGDKPAGNPHLREAFLQGLRDLGDVEGRNLVIEYRSAEGQFERFPKPGDLPVEQPTKFELVINLKSSTT